jgi:hypothetical protein
MLLLLLLMLLCCDLIAGNSGWQACPRVRCGTQLQVWQAPAE